MRYEGVLQVIRCNLSRLMGERKLKIIDVARDTGLHRVFVSALYNETASRIEFEAIDALCKYFDCTVGEIFERVATDARAAENTKAKTTRVRRAR